MPVIDLDNSLKPTDHYILRKVHDDLLPWMICGRLVKRQWFVRLATFNAYAADSLAALAGLGIGAPIVALTSGHVAQGQNALDILHQSLPGAWFIVGVAGLACWIVLRIVSKQEDVVGRALFARDCAQSMKGLFQELFIALADPTPMQEIIRIQRLVEHKVDGAIKNRVWPWDPLPTKGEISAELAKITNDIRSTHMARWTAVPPEAQVA